VRYRQPPVSPEGLGGDLDAGRGLAALVLVAVDHLHDAGDGLAFEALVGDLLDAAVVLVGQLIK